MGQQEANEHIYKLDILYAQAFNKLDWENQLLVCPAPFPNLGMQTGNGDIPCQWEYPLGQNHSPTLPKLRSGKGDMLSHPLCNHTGRVDALLKSIDILKHWLTKVDTDQELLNCIVE